MKFKRFIALLLSFIIIFGNLSYYGFASSTDISVVEHKNEVVEKSSIKDFEEVVLDKENDEASKSYENIDKSSYEENQDLEKILDEKNIEESKIEESKESEKNDVSEIPLDKKDIKETEVSKNEEKEEVLKETSKQTENSKELEKTDIVKENKNEEIKSDVDKNTIKSRSIENKRTFDIQEIPYWRSSSNFGISYESRWEGVVPYGPLFGHMVNNGKDTRPLGEVNGDYGWGWGSSDWLTGYLLVDIDSFGENGIDGLLKDEYSLSEIGIVRVDNKYSRNDSFSSWQDSIENAFKEYNGNLGFGKKGFGNADVSQDTKLVVWDGYRRIPGYTRIFGKEYVKETQDISSINTKARQSFCNYIKKHLENGAKLEGYITVSGGLRYVYEPTYSVYRYNEPQIINIPQIKITGITYDVELESIDTPDGISIPKFQKLKAGTKLELPSSNKNKYVVLDEFGNQLNDDIIINSNSKFTIKWEKIDVNLDTDGDGLSDYLEINYFATNPNNPDTDGDGLSDYFEVFYSLTDPLKKDTDNNGIDDGEEDLDNDGIINKLEEKYKTHPLLKDTDNDGLTDIEEINIYKTDPNNEDTDGDGVSDKNEIEFGTDPLVANEHFDINYTNKFEKDNVEVGLKISLSKEQAKTLSIKKNENKVYFPENMPGYMASAYDFNVDGTFNDAIISFKFDEKLLPNDAKPTIYYFNEVEQELEPLETTVINGVASAHVKHFSTYILINRTIFEKNIKFSWEDVWDSKFKYDKLEVVLVIDDSSSMRSNDSSFERLKVAKDLVDNLPSNSKIGIIKFSSYSTLLTTTLTDKKEEAKDYLSRTYFNSSGMTYMYEAINEALSLFVDNDSNTLKTIVVLSDGETFDTHNHSNVVSSANSKNIKIYTVGLGNSVSYFDSYLKPLAVNTAGNFYIASQASELSKIYKDINKKIDIILDTDGDGIPDYYEDNLPLFNGITMKLDKDNPDTDGDGLFDGEEVLLKYEYNSDRTKVKVKGIIISNPTKIDSDDDGLSDEEERIFGTDPLNKDTDGDTLSDGDEVALGFDPLEIDGDGDGIPDALELKRGTDPYHYDKSFNEYFEEFTDGLVYGDFLKDNDNLSVVFGQLCGNIVFPVVSDARDIVGCLYNKDFKGAFINLAGVVPASGDSVQVISKITKFVTRNIKNSEKIVDFLIGLNKLSPALVNQVKNEDLFIHSIKNMNYNFDMTRHSQSVAKEVLKKLDVYDDIAIVGKIKAKEVIDSTGAWKEKPTKRGKILDNILNKHNEVTSVNAVVRGLGENFPVVDRLDGDFLVSTKSIDLSVKTYKEPSNLRGKLRRDLKALVNFETLKNGKPRFNEGIFEWKQNSIPLKRSEYNKKALEVVLPDMIVKDEIIDVLNEFKKEVEKNYEEVKVWYVIAK